MLLMLVLAGATTKNIFADTPSSSSLHLFPEPSPLTYEVNANT